MMLHATVPGSNIYGNWSGPPPDVATLNGMSAAIVTLTAAVAVAPFMTTYVGSHRVWPSSSQIAGIVCGGILMLCLAGAAIFLCRRRRRLRRQAHVSEPKDDAVRIRRRLRGKAMSLIIRRARRASSPSAKSRRRWSGATRLQLHSRAFAW
jgi:type VI protein secretion system component VasK